MSVHQATPQSVGQPSQLRMVDPESGNHCAVPCAQVNVERDLYPHCIVWTTIPGCSCILPFIGHMGIATSSGEVLEFMGGGATLAPEGGLSFAPVVRYVQLDPRRARLHSWDHAIARATRKVDGASHGCCVSNCHSFVAECLHEMRYAGVPCWNWLSYLLAVWLFLLGRFTQVGRGLLFVVPTVVGVSLAAWLFLRS